MSAPRPTPRQIALIARQEGADQTVVHEALRRMEQNPRVLRGEVTSPAAFFRGIVRGVLADQQTSGRPAAATHSPTQLPAGPPSPPRHALADRIAGRMALRAKNLFAAGHHRAAVAALLAAEFPDASPATVTWAVANGCSLHQALTR